MSRFAEALRLIRQLWSADGPIDVAGEYFTLEHARLDAELHHPARRPSGSGPTAPACCNWSVNSATDGGRRAAPGPRPVRRSAGAHPGGGRTGRRDPQAITPAKMVVCLIGEPDELSEIMQRPLVKSLVLQLTADALAATGHRHPMGEHWRGIQDIDPRVLSRDRLLRLFDQVDPAAILSVVPHGTPKQVAEQIADFGEAGARVVSVLDYSGMAGQVYAAESARKVREVEDALLQLTGSTS